MSHLGAHLGAALGLVTLAPTQEVIIQFPVDIRYQNDVLATHIGTFYKVLLVLLLLGKSFKVIRVK